MEAQNKIVNLENYKKPDIKMLKISLNYNRVVQKKFMT